MSTETEHAAQVAQVWAENTVTNLLSGAPDGLVVPDYGTPSWARLDARNPLRSAAVITAAELWRRQETEKARLEELYGSDPEAWFREITAKADAAAARLGRSLASAPTWEECRRRRAPRPTAPVRATPEWTPIGIPGRPGWWRHYLDGRQVDLPHSDLDEREKRDAA